MCECFEVYCLSVEVPHIVPLNHLVEEIKGTQIKQPVYQP